MSLRNDLANGLLVWLSGDEATGTCLILDIESEGFSVCDITPDNIETNKELFPDLKSALQAYIDRLP